MGVTFIQALSAAEVASFFTLGITSFCWQLGAEHPSFHICIVVTFGAPKLAYFTKYDLMFDLGRRLRKRMTLTAVAVIQDSFGLRLSLLSHCMASEKF